MKLKSLKLENFRQHEDSCIDFHDGITIISGTNGAGKSTILEAITWTIYGTEAARGNKDSIRFNKAKPRAKVMTELEFCLDNAVYKVVRYLDKAEVYVGGNDAPVVTSQQEVTKYLIEKIGMNKNEFFNTYFTGQKELNFMKNQGAIERKKFISKVMGFEKVREAQEKARSDKNNLEKEISGLKLGLDDLEALQKEKEEINAKLTQVRSILESKQKEFNKTSDELAKTEPEWEKIKELKGKFDKITWELKSIEELNNHHGKAVQNKSENLKNLEEKSRKLAELAQIEAEYKTIELKIKEQEALQGKYTLRQKNLTRVEGLEREIKEKQIQLDEIIKSGKEKKEKIEKLPLIEKEITELSSKIQQIELNLKEIQKIEKQLALITEKGEDGVCPTCERPLKLEYDKVVEGFREHIRNLSAGIEGLSELKKQKSEKDKAIADLNNIQGQYDAERNRYLQVRNEREAKLQEIEKIRKELVETPEGFNIEVLKALISLKDTVIMLDKTRKDLDEAIKTKTEAEERQKLIKEQLQTLNYSEESYKQTEKAYLENKENFHKSREELLKIQGEEKIYLNNLENINKKEQSNREKQQLIADKQEQFGLLYELDRFYGQLWEKLNEEVRPEIAELAGKFLSDLTDNRYSTLEINEKYDICLHDDGEIKPVISGGEEDIVNLCIRLAISQIIAYRSGKALSLLILDEIFGSLDEGRRCNVISLLRKLTGSFEQVILITHIDDIKDEIDHVISIEFDPETGSSKIASVNSNAREKILLYT